MYTYMIEMKKRAIIKAPLPDLSTLVMFYLPSSKIVQDCKP